jgi:RimJ/RimL family protein N-acetyltransferase
MISLEYFSKSDYEELIDWSGYEEFLLQWAGPNFKCPLDEKQLDKYLEGANDINQSDRLIYKAINENGISIGHISLGGIDRENRSGRIGKVLIGNSSIRSKGYGQQMIIAALKIGFEELNLHKITLGVFDFNETAIRCYEKCGFVREGFLSDARKYKETYWNLVEMGILEDEYKKLIRKGKI